MPMPTDPAAAFAYVMGEIDLSVATATHHVLNEPTPGLTRAEENAATLTWLIANLDGLVKQAVDLGLYEPPGGHHTRY